MNLCWPWPTLWQGEIWCLMHLYGENLKMFNFYNWAELIIVKLIETMVYEVPNVKLTCDLLSKATHLDCQIPILTSFSQKSLGCLMDYELDCLGKNKICSIISCSWPWPILTLLRRSAERLRTSRPSNCYLCFTFYFIILSFMFLANLFHLLGKKGWPLVSIVCDVSLCFCHFRLWWALEVTGGLRVNWVTFVRRCFGDECALGSWIDTS